MKGFDCEREKDDRDDKLNRLYKDGDAEELSKDELEERVILALLAAFRANALSGEDDTVTNDYVTVGNDDGFEDFSPEDPVSCVFVCESESGEPLSGCGAAQVCIAVAEVKIRSLESRITELKERLAEYEGK